MNNTLDERFNFFAVEYDNGVVYIKGYPSDVTAYKFFRAVSECICFSDCTNVRVPEIYWHGERVWYDGWHPGMLYRFCDMERKPVWEGHFPEWDH